MPPERDKRYAGYFQAIDLVSKLRFNPADNISNQIYECVRTRIVYIKKAKISQNEYQENFLVLSCNFDVPVNGICYLLPIHIMLNENTYPESYPIVQVDLVHENFMYNPSCTAVLSNGCVYIPMFRNWKRTYTLLQSLQTIQSIFQQTYPICNMIVQGNEPTPKSSRSDHTKSSPPEMLIALQKDHQVTIIPYEEITEGRTLGAGAFSNVREGLYKGETVALKVFKSAPKDKDLVGFKREVIIQSKLKHPNIIQIYGLSYKGDVPVIVMELGGQSLKSKIDSQNPIDIRDRTYRWRKDVALQIASAIKYMHELNYIHRDIKSENIIFSKGQYKLTDFGFSREEDTQTRMTCCGTPAAMAPELFRKIPYNEKVDIYSFGIVLYELFTERHPYDDIHMPDSEIIRAIVLKNLRPTLPQSFPYPDLEIINLIQACWVDNFNERPDINAVIHALNQFNPLD